MCAVIAFSEANNVGLHLEEFEMTKVVSLDLTNSPFLIIGKVVLDNADGDPQNAHVQLRRQDGEDFVTMDETVVRLFDAGKPNRVAASVQVGVDLQIPTVVELACGTHDGNASQAQLAAIKLDFLNNDPAKG
jgi:hypothetical protein